MRKLTELVGKKYGKLLVVEELSPKIRANKRLRRYVRCVCDCGGGKISSWDNVKSGAIKNCGCESSRHGGYGTKLYGVWRRIIQCCTDQNYQAYKNYGGRGISVCEEWLSFPAFRSWATSSGYKEGLSIDRTDNDGDYKPENCRWVTAAEQNKNKRNNVFVEYGGCTITAAEYARATNTPLSTVLYRLRKDRSDHAL